MKHLLLTLAVTGFLALPVLAEEDEFEVLEHEIIRLALGRAKISMKQAIETAAKDAGIARLAGAELSLDGDNPVFELEFLTDGGAVGINVDAVTGKVLKKEQEKPDADEADESKQTLKALGDTKFTLLQAIDSAMKEVKDGTVVAAEAGVEDGHFGFEVEIASGDQFKEVQIDANGNVIKNEVEKAEGQAWTFDRDEPGKTPAGWKFAYTNPADGKAAWTIAKDPKSMSGPNALALDTKSGGGTFNLAIAEKTSYQDVDIRTRIRANSGKEDQGGGLIWRAKDENNYYLCRINPLEKNFRVYKVVGGKRETLGSAEYSSETGRWYVVRAKMVGNHIQCYVDEKTLLDVADDNIKHAGMIGLWTKADASSSFDNIAVKPGKPSKTDQAPPKPTSTEKKEKENEEDGDE